MDIVRYESAGGIVFEGGQVLLLRKPALGEMVLPKGHIESGETVEMAARRETIEETGYTHIEILGDLGVLQAQYPFKEKWYIRTEHYYVMRLQDHERGLVGDYDDAEHDQRTFERAWVPLEAADSRLSFEPARSFMSRARQWRKNSL